MPNGGSSRTEMPPIKILEAKLSAQIECTFYGDKFLRQRMFFENWQKKIINIGTYLNLSNINYLIKILIDKDISFFSLVLLFFY